MQTRESILACRDLSVTYPNGMLAVQDVSLNVYKGECVALVGESGSGKTTIARAALGLLPWGTKVSGSIQLAGCEVVQANAKTLRSLRGLVAGFVAQDPFGACNPLHKVGTHVSEAWAVHEIQPSRDVVIRSLEDLGILDARNAAERYPHQWSGGMLQRASIAAANAHQPALIIADEPTSALDTDLADLTISLLRSTGSAMLLISHDLDLVTRHANRVVRLSHGKAIEKQSVESASRLPIGRVAAQLTNETFILEAEHLSRTYTNRSEIVRAVVDATLQVKRSEIVGVYGNSGSGKSTLLRLLATIESPSSGSLILTGERVPPNKVFARPGLVMPIFQDPVSSLDRRWPAWRIVTEPLTAKHRKLHKSIVERRQLASEYLSRVGLDHINLEARPAELSIGQCQRLAICRALISEPALILADEPTSALDTEIAQSVLRLLAAAAESGVGIVIVSHDQAMLQRLCHRVLNMREGVLAVG